MFSHLEDLFGSLEFGNSGVARIAAMTHEAERLRFQLNVGFNNAELAAQIWEVVCGDVRTYELRDSPIESVEFASAHALLVPYTAKSVTLSFVGVPVSASAVVGELWEAHQVVTQEWFSFDAFLNAELKTTDLLASGSGILAEGPRPFHTSYAAVLERHGLRVAWVNERDPLQWRDGAWLPEKADVQALVFGDSYVIGRDWAEARRLA
jgi:hypothetical protein